MNARMMFARAGDECCQCGNVAKSNTNFQCAYDKAAADKLGIGNIGTGNTSTMATLNNMFAQDDSGYAAQLAISFDTEPSRFGIMHSRTKVGWMSAKELEV